MRTLHIELTEATAEIMRIATEALNRSATHNGHPCLTQPEVAEMFFRELLQADMGLPPHVREAIWDYKDRTGIDLEVAV